MRVPSNNAQSSTTGGDRDEVQAAIDLLRSVPRSELQARGIHLEPKHFYSSANDLEFLRDNLDLWHNRPLPRGILWDLDSQVARLSKLSTYFCELDDVPWSARPDADRCEFHWDNPFWRDADAFVQYAALRELGPRRVVEVGCGWSSLLMARALEQNEQHGTPAVSVHQVDPSFRSEIREALPTEWVQHESALQRTPCSIFEALEAGDVCFYDGSHVARTASDVVWFVSEILPRLRSGVVVHVHDIFWPNDYPDDWVFDRGYSWNEQYMLHAFLMFNDDFEVLMCNAALFAIKRAETAHIYRDTVANGHGCSLWLRRK